MSEKVYRLIAKSSKNHTDHGVFDNMNSLEAVLKQDVDIEDITTNEYNILTANLPTKLEKFAYANIEYKEMGGELEWHPFNKLIKRLVEKEVPVFVQTDLDVDFGEGVVVYHEEESFVIEQMLEYIVAASGREVKDEGFQYTLFRDEQLEEDPLYARPDGDNDYEAEQGKLTIGIGQPDQEDYEGR